MESKKRKTAIQKRYLEFNVPGEAISYNRNFKINHRLRQVYLTPEARKFKDKIKLHMPKFVIEDKDELKMKVDIEYYQSWYFKNGRQRKKDIQNLDKLIIDAVFERLGIDDCKIWTNSNYKIDSEDCYVKIKLTVLDKED